MTTTAAEISQERGNEIFLVETVKTMHGKRYAIVSHSEKIGRNKRIVQTFDHTPEELERAKRIAKKFRKDAEDASNEHS